MRLILLFCLIIAAAPALGDEAAPSTQDKLRYLGDYSLALGRKFGCDGQSEAMVFAIKRFTYVLQFDDADGTAAQDIAKTNLTAGIGQTRTDKSACPAIAEQADAAEQGALHNRPLMQAAGHNIGLVAGAARACQVTDTEVDPLLQAALRYTRNNDAADHAAVDGWLAEGTEEVSAKRIGCEAVTTIFSQVKTMFLP